MTGNPPVWDGVPPLYPGEASVLLSRMGIAPGPPTLAQLTAAQWRFLCVSPFHNLELLAGRSPRSPAEAIAAVLAGRGGPCHVQSTAFLALIRGLGFEAHLAAATITEPGDHMVVVATVGGLRWVCDVGNGHPYRQPFPLEGTIEIEHVGWRFTAVGSGGGVELFRTLPGGRVKRVYRVDPAPRAFGDFRSIIDSHHTAEGFGPFLTGLRAVRIDDDRLVTLRDLMLRRFSVAGERVRPVPDLAAAGRVLTAGFGFEPELVDEALERVAGSASRWPGVERRPLRVAVTVASDRPDVVSLLLGDLGEQARWTSPDVIDEPVVFVLDNTRTGRVTAHLAETKTAGIDVRVIDVAPPTSGRRCIAASRRAQVAAVARAVAAGELFDVVWMLDDDLRLGRLERQDDRLVHDRGYRYFDEIARSWWTRPDISLLVGGVTGDPPIRPDAVLASQLLDLRANLDRFAELLPEAAYHAPDQGAAFDLPDFYYDHARTDAHLDQPFYWLTRASGATVRDAAGRCIDSFTGLFAGRTPTRPLTGTGGVPVGQPWLRRGGNAVFLDLDSALRHPYPTVQLDGVRTRRADMVGTAILHREGGAPAIGWDGSVIHARPPRRDRDAASRRRDLRRSVVSEFYGVLLARAVVDGEVDLEACACRRAARIVERISVGAQRLSEARQAIARAHGTWMGRDRRLARDLRRLDATLEAAEPVYFGGPGSPCWRVEAGALFAEAERVARIADFVEGELSGAVADERRHIADIFSDGSSDGRA